MTEIEKAKFAVMFVGDLLSIEKKILAVKVVKYMYSTGLKNAKQFVDEIEALKKEVPKAVFKDLEQEQ